VEPRRRGNPFSGAPPTIGAAILYGIRTRTQPLRVRVSRPQRKLRTMKGADKQKKMAKKAPQKTLKEKRADKRAAEKNRPV
jgi:hypothetical protein